MKVIITTKDKAGLTMVEVEALRLSLFTDKDEDNQALESYMEDYGVKAGVEANDAWGVLSAITDRSGNNKVLILQNKHEEGRIEVDGRVILEWPK